MRWTKRILPVVILTFIFVMAFLVLGDLSDSWPLKAYSDWVGRPISNTSLVYFCLIDGWFGYTVLSALDSIERRLYDTDVRLFKLLKERDLGLDAE
jgi:hypothetical protein